MMSHLQIQVAFQHCYFRLKTRKGKCFLINLILQKAEPNFYKNLLNRFPLLTDTALIKFFIEPVWKLMFQAFEHQD